MKRVFCFIFFVLLIFSVSAVSAVSPSPAPNVNVPMGLLVPGVNCGVAGDADSTKTKCCIPKKAENSGVMDTVTGFASGIPVIGGYVNGLSESYSSMSALQNQSEPCAYGIPSSSGSDCICIKSASESAIPSFTKFCNDYFSGSTSGAEKAKCMQCMETTGGFYTSIGCVPLDLSTFITSYILTIGIGIAGGVALLCIFYSAFRMQTSMGNAEAIKKAQENLTACITGLVIVIFSVLILKIIGVDILRIPGLGK